MPCQIARESGWNHLRLSRNASLPQVSREALDSDGLKVRAWGVIWEGWGLRQTNRQTGREDAVRRTQA